MTKEVFQLEVQIPTAPALAGLRALNKELDETKKKAEAIKPTGVQGLKPAVEGVTSAFKGLGSVLAGLGLAKIASDAVRAMADFETLNTVLKTVTGSAEGAAAGIQLIQAVSKETPFTIEAIGNSFIKLRSSGIEPTSEKLRLFADIASVTTDKLGALRAITDLYSRTTAGGLGLEELNRLADRGIPVFDILGKRLGVSRLQLSELGKTAEGANIILRQLEQGLGSQFGGNAAAQINTLNGQFDQLKKNLETTFINIGTSGATEGLKDLLKVFNEIIVSSDGTSKSVGKVLGESLKGLAETIKFLTENINALIGVLLALAVVFTPWGKILGAFRLGIAGTDTAVQALAVTFAKTFAGKVTSFALITTGIVLLTKFTALAAEAIAKTGLLSREQLGLPKAVDPANQSGKYNFPDTAGAGRGKSQGATTSELLDTLEADRKRTVDLMTGREGAILKVIEALKKETAIVGLTSKELEYQNKIFEVQEGIRQKLIATGKTEEEAQSLSRLSTVETGRLRSEIDKKFAAQQAFQFSEFKKNASFEIQLIGLSSNEIEKQTKLREYLVSIGKLETATEKEKLEVLKQIGAVQDARINDSLNKNLEGLNKEIEYLKLGNKEREIRIALDQAAADAGYKNAEELIKKQPLRAGEIRSTVGTRYLTGIDVEGQKQIDNMKEQVRLNTILDEQERARAQNRLDIYKAIDPEGKGANITRAQKQEIENLQATLEAQQKLLEVNKKITDQYGALGDAVSGWVLGSKDGIRQVRLELLKLAALSAYKYFAGGDSGGALGSFISGAIGGISGARANGGPVDANKSYIVGEKRPEIFVPQVPGYIVPNTSMMNSRTGSVSNVTLSPNLVINGGVTGQSELDRAFEQFADAMASQTQKLIISQRGNQGILAR